MRKTNGSAVMLTLPRAKRHELLDVAALRRRRAANRIARRARVTQGMKRRGK